MKENCVDIFFDFPLRRFSIPVQSKTKVIGEPSAKNIQACYDAVAVEITVINDLISSRKRHRFFFEDSYLECN